jgi:5-methyltetrahydrofolate--homocysteine methyltransferase
MAENVLSQIKEAMVSLQEEELSLLVRNSVNTGADPLKVIDALRNGIWEVGTKYEKGQYFISELIIAGEMMKRNVETLKPYLRPRQVSARGTIVLGAAFGDLHDIGKEIVKSLLMAEGFDVDDLGVDVSPSKFVDQVQQTRARVLGISALLSTSTPAAAKVVDELNNRDVRKNSRVILGGAAVRDWMVKDYGVDAAVNDAVKGIKLIRSWVQEP